VGITIGQVIAALAFTISIQQFLKPIHRFRLQAWGVPLLWLYVGVFSGAALVFSGNLLRYIAVEWSVILWLAPALEFAGALLFFMAYLATGFISLSPARLRSRNVLSFTRAAFAILSTADEENYVALFNDISANTATLAKTAAFADSYRWSGVGSGEPSAFYDFVHRKKLADASYASTLFELLSDPSCCATMVRRNPTTVVSMLSELSDKQIVCDAAGLLVQELARQAVLREDSMLAREVGYKGFSSVGLFLNSMFGDVFILRTYKPFSNLTYLGDVTITPGVAERLGEAIETAWEKTNELWHPQSLWQTASVLKSAFFSIRYSDSRKARHELEHFRLYTSVARILKATEKRVSENKYEPKSLYAKDDKVSHDDTMPGLAARIAINALNSVSNDFEGPEDRRWSDVLTIMRELFPSIGEAPDGLSPTQQHAMLMIDEKLADNMDGYYPALTRVLLSVIGPHGSRDQKNQTAFRILEDVAYARWKKFPALHNKKPEKVEDKLPPNVTFDSTRSVLEYTYRSGETVETNLSTLAVPSIDLFDPSLRRRQVKM